MIEIVYNWVKILNVDIVIIIIIIFFFFFLVKWGLGKFVLGLKHRFILEFLEEVLKGSSFKPKVWKFSFDKIFIF